MNKHLSNKTKVNCKKNTKCIWNETSKTVKETFVFLNVSERQF